VHTPAVANPTQANLDSDTIFISIASYCDPLLKATIEDACAKAIYPDRLRFGVVEQTDLALRLALADMPQAKQIRYLAIDRSHSRGVCWARNVAMSLYQQEDWFFQIDSHMLFKHGWDINLLQSAQECAEINPDFAISSYPNPFNIVDGIPTPQAVTDKILAHVVRGDCQFTEFLGLGFTAMGVDQDTPVKGFHLGAGCLFAPGRLVSLFPYDAQIYFEGEEQTMAARLFTHGWDIFHVAGLPIYHLYERADAPSRPKHWGEAENVERQQKWYDLSASAKKRVNEILRNEGDFGIYGLGQVRTMQEYAALSGIDYINQQLSETARNGFWGKGAQQDLPTPRQRISINIVEQNPFMPRPFVFSDVAHYLYKALQAAGLRVRHSVQPIDDVRQINIILAAPQRAMEMVNALMSKNNIIFNFEQLGSDSVLINAQYLSWLKDKLVFDYHSKNIERLKEINGEQQQAFEIPLTTASALNYYPESPHSDEIDVLFFGGMSARRIALVERLKASGLRVEVVVGAYGRELTPAIKRAKIILHVHFYETALFPFMRFMQAIPCHIPILCERSVMSANSDWQASGITFADYDDLVEAAHALIALDDSERQSNAHKLLAFSQNVSPGDQIKEILLRLNKYAD
jgi:hypothetical protein